MSRSTRTFATLSLLALLGSIQGVSAQDDGLYDAPIDPNSAFVRVLSPGAAVAVVNGTTVDQVTDGLSAYVNVDPGDIQVAAGDVSGSVSAAPGAYYTYAWSAAGDPVVLLGAQGDERITSQDWADRLDTIPYEVVCGFSVRLPRRVRPLTRPVDLRAAAG